MVQKASQCGTTTRTTPAIPTSVSPTVADNAPLIVARQSLAWPRRVINHTASQANTSGTSPNVAAFSFTRIAAPIAIPPAKAHTGRRPPSIHAANATNTNSACSDSGSAAPVAQ
ncbi:hypothetical protein HS125_08315 [bacterium]|nr:hypothetical protein [bacterium]